MQGTRPPSSLSNVPHSHTFWTKKHAGFMLGGVRVQGEVRQKHTLGGP